MTTCCFTSVFLKTLLTKGLVENWPFKSSEGWTLVNFKMFNAKACINKTCLNRILHEKTLPKIVCFEPCCHEKRVVSQGCS